MRYDIGGDEQFVRYLLGDLPERERDEFEDRYLADEAVHVQLLAVEAELIDAYVQGTLSPSDRVAFEERFLSSPERRERIEFARMLQLTVSSALLTTAAPHPIEEPFRTGDRSEAASPGAWPASAAASGELRVQGLVDDREPPSPEIMPREPLGEPWWRVFFGLRAFRGPGLRFAGVAAALLLLTLGVLYYRGKQETTSIATKNGEQRAPEQSERPRSETERAHNPTTVGWPPTPSAPAQVAKNQHKTPAFLSFVLLSVTRGEGRENVLSVPQGDYQVRLRLDLETDAYPRYLAVIETDDGTQVDRENLKSQQVGSGKKAVILTLPAASLKTGDYVLKLSGIDEGRSPETVAGYSFRVQR